MLVTVGVTGGIRSLNMSSGCSGGISGTCVRKSSQKTPWQPRVTERCYIYNLRFTKFPQKRRSKQSIIEAPPVASLLKKALWEVWSIYWACALCLPVDDTELMQTSYLQQVKTSVFDPFSVLICNLLVYDGLSSCIIYWNTFSALNRAVAFSCIPAPL